MIKYYNVDTEDWFLKKNRLGEGGILRTNWLYFNLSEVTRVYSNPTVTPEEHSKTPPVDSLR